MSSSLVQVSKAWNESYAEARAGILVMSRVSNPPHHAALDEQKANLEARLRSQFSGYDRPRLAENPILQAYNKYFKQFKKTYHVQLQLESVVFKLKSIPNVSGLVEAMFMAELQNMLLTAGHDLDAVKSPVTVDVAKGDERYVLINGQEQFAKSGDMMMVDGLGVISSVLHGPDQRTRIMPDTRWVLFMVYVPPGIPEQLVHQHLHDIQSNVLTIAPEAQTDLLQVYGGSP
jgi:DNA/RNA-binding domain of Phe-tRNA-synthetase-like protein